MLGIIGAAAALAALLFTAGAVILGEMLVGIRIGSFEETRQWGLDNGEYGEDFASSAKAEFSVSSPHGYELRGWVFPGTVPRTVVFCHGVSSSRWGMVKYMGPFRELGWNMVLYDHRAHGQSGGGYPTYGVREKDDLSVITAYARKRFPGSEAFALYGESMGAAVVLQYAPMDADLTFIVSDCVYSDLGDLCLYKMRRMGIPALVRSPLLRAADVYTRIRGGFSLLEVSPIREIMKTEVPLLLLHGAADEFTPCSMSETIYESRKHAAPTELTLIDGAEHALSWAADPKRYEARTREFIDKYSDR